MVHACQVWEKPGDSSLWWKITVSLSKLSTHSQNCNRQEEHRMSQLFLGLRSLVGSSAAPYKDSGPWDRIEMTFCCYSLLIYRWLALKTPQAGKVYQRRVCLGLLCPRPRHQHSSQHLQGGQGYGNPSYWGCLFRWYVQASNSSLWRWN